MKVTPTGHAVKVVTDTVELSAVYLNGSYEFDTKFGSVNATIAIDDKDYRGSELEGVILAASQLSLETAKKDNPKAKNQITSVVKAIDEVDESGEVTGRILLKVKNKCKFEKDGELFDRKLIVVDGHKNAVENYTQLTAGTKARVSFSIVGYYMASRKEAGISLWLNGLQIVEPVWYEGGNDFEDEGDTAWTAPKTLAEFQKPVVDANNVTDLEDDSDQALEDMLDNA